MEGQPIVDTFLCDICLLACEGEDDPSFEDRIGLWTKTMIAWAPLFSMVPNWSASLALKKLDLMQILP